MNFDFQKYKNKKSVILTSYLEKDLTPLAALIKVEKLELSASNLQNLNGIENLIYLTDLKIKGVVNLTSLKAIKSIAHQLTSLEIQSCKLHDFNILGDLIHLTTLSLSHIHHIESLSFMEELKKLKDLTLYHIGKCDSLNFLYKMNCIENIYITPWYCNVDDKSFLPLTKKLVTLGKLKQVIEWEDVHHHLDEEGMKIYNDYFNVPALQFIKREFSFHCYEDFSEPYTKENCDLVDATIYKLINDLEKNKKINKTQQLKYFKSTVLELNKLNNKIEGLISTGERELLCDTLDAIATAIHIDLKPFEDGIATKWRTW